MDIRSKKSKTMLAAAARILSTTGATRDEPSGWRLATVDMSGGDDGGQAGQKRAKPAVRSSDKQEKRRDNNPNSPSEKQQQQQPRKPTKTKVNPRKSIVRLILVLLLANEIFNQLISEQSEPVCQTDRETRINCLNFGEENEQSPSGLERVAHFDGTGGVAVIGGRHFFSPWFCPLATTKLSVLSVAMQIVRPIAAAELEPNDHPNATTATATSETPTQVGAVQQQTEAAGPQQASRRLEATAATNLSLSSTAEQQQPSSSSAAPTTTTRPRAEQEQAASQSVVGGAAGSGNKSVGATDAGGVLGARPETTLQLQTAPNSTAESITTTESGGGGGPIGTTTASTTSAPATTTTRRPILSFLFGSSTDHDEDQRPPPVATKTIAPKLGDGGSNEAALGQQQQPSKATLNLTQRKNNNNNNHANHQANLQLANKVACNSRCKCLIVELLANENEITQQQRHNDTTQQQSEAGKELDKTLSLFYADYSLDDDCEQLSSLSAAGSGGDASAKSLPAIHLQQDFEQVESLEQQQQILAASRRGRKFAKTNEVDQPQQIPSFGGKLATKKSPNFGPLADGDPPLAHHQLAGSSHQPIKGDEHSKPLLYPHYNQFYPNARFPFLSQQQQQQARLPATKDDSVAPSGGPASSYPVVYHHHNRLHSRQPPVVPPPTPAALKSPASSNQHHPQVKQILPLRSLDLSNGQLTTTTNETQNSTDEQSQLLAQSERLIELLDSIEEKNIQSLSLRNNDIKFEYLTQLYALISLPMRQNLFHLDLSHNSLVKLGVTFTGYIEHQLAAAMQKSMASSTAANDSSPRFDEINWWPFNHLNNSSYSSGFHQQQSEEQQILSNGVVNNLKTFASNGNLVNANKQRLRLHPILGDGKLFTLVVRRLSLRQMATTTTKNHSSELLLLDDFVIPKTNLSHLLDLYFNFTTQLHQTTLIKALDLSHNKLKWLINDQFRALKQVQSIRLNSNKIRFIHQQAFNGLESLKYINLNSNRIQTIYVEQFQTNFNLQALMLRSNYLAYLRAGSFASLSNLKLLDLSKNKFTILSNNAFVGLESLESLNLSSNQFVHVPSSSLHPMTSLVRLDLSNNQLAQLVPGTFFHLTIEELSLNDNEQLVVIDRGAFWDLPYLRRLNLSSNPMLVNINSQAFVGTQNLQLIEVDDCPALDSSARQMLDNITMAATSRQLRIEQQTDIRLNGEQYQQPTPMAPAANKTTAIEQTTTTTMRQSPPITNIDKLQERLQGVDQHHQQANYWKYFHSVVLITMLAVALKFVFKLTRTRNYLETRRRARRVYQASSDSSADCSSSSSDSIDDMNCSITGNSIALCEQQPEIHVIGLAGSTNNSNMGHQQATTTRRCSLSSSSSSSCSSSPVVASSLDQLEGVTPNDDDRDVDDSCQLMSTMSSMEGDNAISMNDNHYNNVITQARQPIDGETSQYCPDCSPAHLTQMSPTTNIGHHQQSIGMINANEQLNDTANHCCDQQTAGTQLQQSVTDQDYHQQQQQSEIVQQVVADVNHTNNLPSTTTIPAANDPTTPTTLEMIHNQLVEAGFDYGHANCLHFYQSLGPALQFADMTANYVNQMDYYS